jgi:hypothetical protein
LGSALRIEVEVQPFSVNFTGTPTADALAVIPDTTTATNANIAVVHVTGLANFNYHWQCRSVDQMGRRSPWFAAASIGNTSFRVDTTATGGGGGGGGTPPPPVVATTSSGNKGNCGLLGLEAVAALGLIRLLRRRRSGK